MATQNYLFVFPWYWSFALNPGQESDYKRDWTGSPSNGPGFIWGQVPPCPWVLLTVLAGGHLDLNPSIFMCLSLQPAAPTALKIIPNEFVSPQCLRECHKILEKSMLEFVLCSASVSWIVGVRSIKCGESNLCLLESEFKFFLYFYI